MSNRTNTVEQLGTKIVFPSAAGSATVGRLILAGEQPTKWMTRQAALDYSMAIVEGLPNIEAALLTDRHTRQAVLHGPKGACWVATQVISNGAGYQVFCFYRSMEDQHLMFDRDLQTAIAHSMLACVGGRINKLTFFITSYHSYK